MTDIYTSSRPRLIVRRLGERRKTTYLKGPPFMSKAGAVFLDRRSRRDRRQGAGPEICALLRSRNKGFKPVKSDV